MQPCAGKPIGSEIDMACCLWLGGGTDSEEKRAVQSGAECELDDKSVPEQTYYREPGSDPEETSLWGEAHYSIHFAAAAITTLSSFIRVQSMSLSACFWRRSGKCHLGT